MVKGILVGLTALLLVGCDAITADYVEREVNAKGEEIVYWIDCDEWKVTVQALMWGEVVYGHRKLNERC